MSEEDAPADSYIKVTYDAGGGGSCVHCEPFRAWWYNEEKTEVVVRWALDRQVNTAPDWEATFANIVRCDREMDLPNFRSVQGEDWRTWEWIFEVPEEVRNGKEMLIQYEIYFAYTPKDDRRSLFGKNSSFRMLSNLDPTIILPPRLGP